MCQLGRLNDQQLINTKASTMRERKGPAGPGEAHRSRLPVVCAWRGQERACVGVVVVTGLGLRTRYRSPFCWGLCGGCQERCRGCVVGVWQGTTGTGEGLW